MDSHRGHTESERRNTWSGLALPCCPIATSSVTRHAPPVPGATAILRTSGRRSTSLCSHPIKAVHHTRGPQKLIGRALSPGNAALVEQRCTHSVPCEASPAAPARRTAPPTQRGSGIRGQFHSRHHHRGIGRDPLAQKYVQQLGVTCNPTASGAATAIRGCGVNPYVYSSGMAARRNILSQHRTTSRWEMKRTEAPRPKLRRSRCIVVCPDVRAGSRGPKLLRDYHFLYVHAAHLRNNELQVCRI